jgi:hypothetical protein
MSKLFIVSSVGDTDLAKETIKRLLASGYSDPIFILPLTSTASKRVNDLHESPILKILALEEILRSSEIPPRLDAEQYTLVNNFISDNHIDMAYVGVPSPSKEDLPFQIATVLKIPFVIASEFMFKAEDHCFWSHVRMLANNEYCSFAVPLPGAEADIKEIAPEAKVQVMSHLSIAKAMAAAPAINVAEIKAKLAIPVDERFIFVSGTTREHTVDNAFLNALLAELNTKKYPKLQIRLGIHPGVSDMPKYLDLLLETCRKYPETSAQFKIILPERAVSYSAEPFVVLADVNGPTASNAADSVGQAAPGALLNEAAIQGKPVCSHEEVHPYLPEYLFAKTLPTFFSTPPRERCTLDEIGLTGDMVDPSSIMMKIMGNT